MSRYTKEYLENLVSESKSLREVLIKAGLVPAGGNYAHLKNMIEIFNINTDHFLGRHRVFSEKDNNKKPAEYYLRYWDRTKHVSSSRIAKVILRDKIKKHVCEICGLSSWLGNPIPLEIHHKDGDSWNNNIENLVLLCPNCHAFTDNYRGKKLKGKPNFYNSKNYKSKNLCVDCGRNIGKKATRCRSCTNELRKNKYNILEVKASVEKLGVMATSKIYNVSHTTIRRWLSSSCDGNQQT